MLCLHRHHDFGCLCFDEVGYTHVGMNLLRQLFCFVFLSHLWISVNDLQETTVFGVFLLAGNIRSTRLTHDWKKKKIKKKACPAPGCQEIQHHCHRTSRKPYSSSCESQFILQTPPLEAERTHLGSCVVPAVAWAKCNGYLCKMKVLFPWLQTNCSRCNYTFAAGLERTSQTSHAVLSQISFIWDFAQ